MKSVPPASGNLTTSSLPHLTVLTGTLLVVLLGGGALLGVVMMAQVEEKRDQDQPSDSDQGVSKHYVPADLGEGYAYGPATLRKFGMFLRSPRWSPADPIRNRQGMLEAIHNPTRLAFVLIPVGKFNMGSLKDEEGREADEGPVRALFVPPFLLCKTEFTNRAWYKVQSEEARKRWEMRRGRRDGAPVMGVSWDRASLLCRRMGLRLPSETEWEYACRAGTWKPFWTGRILTTDDANYNGRTAYGGGKKGLFRNSPVDAGSLPPNQWGLHEVHGNVWEWCLDWYGDYIDAPANGSPRKVRGSALGRVIRGGSYSYSAAHCRSANRNWLASGEAGNRLGFRPAADLAVLD